MSLCFLMKKTLHLQKCNPHNNPRRPLLLTALDREESRGSGRLRDLPRKSKRQSPIRMRSYLLLQVKLFLLQSEGVPLRGCSERQGAADWTLAGVLALLQMFPGTSGSSWGLSIREMGVDAAFCPEALSDSRNPCSRSDNGA